MNPTLIPFIQGTASTVSDDLWAMVLRGVDCSGYLTTRMRIKTTLPPAATTTNNTETNQYFYHSDHLGSSSFISDAIGYATQHLQYLPYGETFVDQHGAFDSRYTFSAKEKDDETQYSYFGARYYDSDLSVWLSVDPMASSRSWISPYNYCQWNPVGRVDPSGALDTEPERKKAIARAREHVAKGTYYLWGGSNNQPGKGNDCAGLMFELMTYVGYSSKSVYGPGMPDGGSNTVSIIVSKTKPLSISEMEEGSFVTFRSGRDDHQGPNGKYDHMGIVTSIKRNEGGEIEGFSFVHCASDGAVEMYYDFTKEQHTKWGNKQLLLTGVYKWDNEEMYTGGFLQTVEISGESGYCTPYIEPKSACEIPIDLYNIVLPRLEGVDCAVN